MPDARALVLRRMEADTSLVEAQADYVRSLTRNRDRVVDATVSIDSKMSEAMTADLKKDRTDSRISTWLAFFLDAAFIGGTLYCAVTDKLLYGILLVFGLLLINSVFSIRGRTPSEPLDDSRGVDDDAEK